MASQGVHAQIRSLCISFYASPSPHQASKWPGCALNTPGPFLPQGLCTCYMYPLLESPLWNRAGLSPSPPAGTGKGSGGSPGFLPLLVLYGTYLFHTLNVFTILAILSVSSIPHPHKCKIHRNRDFCLSCSLLYPTPSTR